MFHKLSGNTSRLYLISQKYILHYLKMEYKSDDMELVLLDYKFIIGFENFLRGFKPKHYRNKIGNNAVMKHIQRLGKMIRLAHEIEWIDHDPFRKFKQKLIPTYRGFLTAGELQCIEEVKIDSLRFRTVKDLFVFSCYTGISYVDLMLLTNESLIMGMDNMYWIATQRHKNGNQVNVPLLQKALNIIKTYQNDKRCLVKNTLFPRISNQKVNAYLKEIAVAAKIKRT